MCRHEEMVWKETSNPRPFFVGWLCLKIKMLCVFELATCLCIRHFLNFLMHEEGLWEETLDFEFLNECSPLIDKTKI